MESPRFERIHLIYNPVAGRLRRHPERLAEVQRLLRADGAEVVATPTPGPLAGAETARGAIAAGADLVLVAGGDGTINEVANGMIGTGVAFGALPGGTANVLCNELGLGNNMVRAARRLRECEAVETAAGLLTPTGAPPRHFLMMAGVGLDARVVHDVPPRWKKPLGKLAYWVGGLRQVGRPLEQFEARWEGGRAQCGFALASRVRNYGGDLVIAAHAGLRRDDLALVLFSGRSSLRYLLHFAWVLLRQQRRAPGLRLAHAAAVDFEPLGPGVIHVQIDGELHGRLPARVEVVPRALQLLLPVRRRL